MGPCDSSVGESEAGIEHAEPNRVARGAEVFAQHKGFLVEFLALWVFPNAEPGNERGGKILTPTSVKAPRAT